MVLTLNGNSETRAHEKSNPCYLSLLFDMFKAYFVHTESVKTYFVHSSFVTALDLNKYRKQIK